jgi:hypothetical protein
MRVPPWPSLAEVNWLAMYWPSSVMLAVLIPSVTVSVPLKLLPASVKLTLVLDPKAMADSLDEGVVTPVCGARNFLRLGVSRAGGIM